MTQRTFVTFSTVALALALSAGTAQNEGEQVYQQCAACHGAEGEGIGAAPALAGNQNLQEASYHISRILNGGAGMPAFRDQLSDAEIAAVATFERTSWGNDFGEVTAEQVAQERGGQATGGSEDTTGQSEAGAEAVSEERTNVEETAGTASAAQSPVTISTEVIAEGLVSPVQLTAPEGDDRRFVVDRVGMIYILNADDQRLETPFLNLSDKLVDLQEDFDERGLLGLAFHPNYAENGHFYVYYSSPLRESAPDNWDHTARVSEFTVLADKPNRADPNSERVLLEVDQPQFNHNGGALAFSPEDGYLYIALGDGGAADDVALGHPPMGHGQDVTSLLGNVLRIDVDRGWPGYAVPQDNPLVDKEGHDEIYSWGWRNPWRMSFDRGGDHGLFVATNGQNLWEAVYEASEPGNYGWNLLEGTHCFDPKLPNESPENCARVGANGEPLQLPVIEYPHLANQGDSVVAGASVIGGYVYRGAAIPELTGRYVFGDWSSDFAEPKGQLLMATLTNTPGALWALEQIAQLDAYVLGFGEDSSGELYALTTESTGPTGTTGKVHRIVAGQ
ncbi:MAG: hypothetical protein AVDCRST_MAG86-2662 [uncultured Truepera sp.]|uniref:Cytochrome c domain-containing protein n=1 Tax=uncultured Truepera sp. TaxID=543023 RepID=A0A6J4VIV3_9DEIN|nr:MAG: hypothetical protein AVDCRST_MAG86-2662 [uncultured Truepera sp.]